MIEAPIGPDGIEYAALLVLDTDVSRKGWMNETATVAHELAHQWFPAEVGTDQVTEPWIDESIATWASLRVVREIHGDARYWEMVRFLGEWGSAEEVAGLPADVPAATHPFVYRLAYSRGALFWVAVAQRWGEERLDAAFLSFVTRHRGGRVDGQTVLAEIGEALGAPEELREMARKWLADGRELEAWRGR